MFFKTKAWTLYFGEEYFGISEPKWDVSLVGTLAQNDTVLNLSHSGTLGSGELDRWEEVLVFQLFNIGFSPDEGISQDEKNIFIT